MAHNRSNSCTGCTYYIKIKQICMITVACHPSLPGGLSCCCRPWPLRWWTANWIGVWTSWRVRRCLDTTWKTDCSGAAGKAEQMGAESWVVLVDVCCLVVACWWLWCGVLLSLLLLISFWDTQRDVLHHGFAAPGKDACLMESVLIYMCIGTHMNPMCSCSLNIGHPVDGFPLNVPQAW